MIRCDLRGEVLALSVEGHNVANSGLLEDGGANEPELEGVSRCILRAGRCGRGTAQAREGMAAFKLARVLKRIFYSK